jgi:hypothetical protein
MITSKHNRRALNKRQLSIALIGNVHCFERRKLYSQATQKYVIASSNLNKQFVLIEHHLQNIVYLLVFIHQLTTSKKCRNY